MSDSSFAIELNEKCTRICDARFSGKKIELLSVGIVETTPLYFSSDNEKVIESQAEIIAKMVDNLKIKKKNVHVILPDGFTYSQIIEMPKLKEKELLAAIRYQADEFIPMPIDETSIDLEILKEDSKSKKVLILIVASPKKIVAQIEKTIERANLFPETLENELSSVGRLISAVSPNTEGVALYINFGFSHSSLYLVDTASSLIIASRSIKIGLELFIRDIRANLNWEDAKVYEVLRTIGLNKDGSYDIETIIAPLMKELFQEIEKVIVLGRDTYNLKIDRLFLMNFDTYIAMFNKRLEAYFSMPAASFDLRNNLVANPISQSFGKNMSSFISAIAANLR